jgi:hypothetical protein
MANKSKTWHDGWRQVGPMQIWLENPRGNLHEQDISNSLIRNGTLVKTSLWGTRHYRSIQIQMNGLSPRIMGSSPLHVIPFQIRDLLPIYIPIDSAVSNRSNDLYNTQPKGKKTQSNFLGRDFQNPVTGATGVQVLQELGPYVKHLVVLHRLPNCAMPMGQKA